jgi:hypothetical protein
MRRSRELDGDTATASPPCRTIAAVADDEDLADRIRELVGSDSGLTEQKMFG